MFKQKVHPLVTLTIVAIVIGIFTLYLYALKPSPASEPKIIGGDKDSHGCLSGAGYSWCSATNKCIRSWEELCEDRVFENFRNIEKIIKTDFSEIKNTEIRWLVENNTETIELKISGYEVDAESLDQEDFEKMSNYFNNNGFTESNLNTSSETGSYYHEKFSLTCNINTADNDNKMNISLSCGLLDKKILETISQNNELKNIISEKNSAKISEINLVIEEENDNYLRGTFNVSPATYKTTFLAQKNNDNWKLVYWGNGILKCDLTEKGFTPEMLNGCVK